MLFRSERLCEIETLWQGEDQGDDDDAALPPDLADSFGQLDLLLREIRMDAEEA